MLKNKEGDPSLTLGMTERQNKEGDPSLTLGMTKKRVSFRACDYPLCHSEPAIAGEESPPFSEGSPPFKF
jgi:hypothetical protein